MARAGIAFDREAGWRVDRRSGHRTAYVQASSTGSVTVGGRVLGLSGDGQETYAVEYDETGRPVDLRVIATGSFAGSRDLPAVVQQVAGLLATDAGEGERGYEVTGHLDLTDAGNLVAARGLLNAIADRQATAAPERALRRRIDEHGTVQARVLASRDRRDRARAWTSRAGRAASAPKRRSSSAPSSCWPRPRAGSTGNGSRGPTAWHERGRRPHVRTYVRVIRRAPLPFGLLVPGRRLAARGAGRGGAGARASGAGADRPQLGLGVDGVRPGRVVAGLARDPWGGGGPGRPGNGACAARGRGAQRRRAGGALDGARHAAGPRWARLAQPLPAPHAGARAYARVVGPAARARAGADGRRPRRARRGPGLPVGLRGSWRPRRADRPRAAGGLRARRVPDRAAAPVSSRRPGAQPRAGRAGRTARGAVRRDGQRPRPRAGARAAAGRARGGPRAHDAGRLRAAATRQPHARAHDAGGDGGALRGPPRRGGRDRAPGRHADLRPHRRPRLPLSGGRGRRGRPQARRGVRPRASTRATRRAAACGPLRPRGWTRSWR